MSIHQLPRAASHGHPPTPSACPPPMATHRLIPAFPVEGATIRVSTAAAPKLVIIPVFCPTYTGVMALDNHAHIGHTTVANFDHAPVKDLT